MSNYILNGVMGLCVADALGVPVEFVDRKTLEKDPVIDMRSFGTYNQPIGTWSDDTSMTLCLVDSLSNGLDYNYIMESFMEWFNKGEYTPFGEVFDMGNATREALMRFEKGTAPLAAGGISDNDNGNGSLMRILPIVFYLNSIYGTEITKNDEAMNIIHNVSSLTHAHKRSQIACGIYCSVASNLMGDMCFTSAVERGIYSAVKYYKTHDEFTDEISYYERLSDKNFSEIPLENIKSSGYVVDTLEAAIWCLLKTKSYKDCVLMAVNLGEDTDTVAAVAGGLAGLYYGYESIPIEWCDVIVKRDYIESLCNKLFIALNRNSIEKLCDYTTYFETATEKSVCNFEGGEKIGEKSFSMAYAVYEDTLEKFIQDVYKSNLMCNNYSEIIDSRGLNNREEIIDAIDTADFELVKAILTRYVRGEHFCEGSWGTAVEENVFLKILQRLKQL